MKGPFKSNKKYKLNKLTDSYKVSAESLNNLYDWGISKLNEDISGWNVDPTYIKEAYSADLPLKGSANPGMDPYQIHYEWTEQERKLLVEKWVGALVRLIPIPDWTNNYWPLNMQPGRGQPKSSRNDWDVSNKPKGLGTVIELEKEPNYKGQWNASILWSDGLMSYENIADLIIIPEEAGQ